MRGPAPGIACLPRNFDKRAMPKILFGPLLSVAVAYRQCRRFAKFDKLTIPLGDLSCREYRRAARGAFPGPWRQDATAFGTKRYDRFPIRLTFV
jgi:hypothetical protein